MSGYSQSRVLEGTYHEHRTTSDTVKPLDKVDCKRRGCTRSVYANGICKLHADIEYYKQLTKNK